MASPLNPITHAAALAVDPNLSPEARAQALFHVWLKKYFSGVAFTTRTANGGTEEKTFHACDVTFQEAPPVDPEDEEGLRPPQSKPVIHGVLIDQRGQRSDSAADMFSEDLDWTMQLMVKVPPNLTGAGQVKTDPRFLVREVADQLAWLLCSSERAALSEKGVLNLTKRSGPVLLPTSSWFARLIVVNFRMIRSVPLR